MVLGLGSRSKKERAASAAALLVDLELHLNEIRPWQTLRRSSSKTQPPVVLRWNRGEKAVGTSKVLNPVPGGDVSNPEIEKFVLDESIRISVAPNREALKRAKRLLPDLDRPLMFSILETNNLKGQPIAIASLDLTPFVALPNAQTFSVHFNVQKKISPKGISPRLHFTVAPYVENDASASVSDSFGVSSANSISSRNSDASSAPPLDEDQRAAVAALLSDEDDDLEEEIAPFTDEEDDDQDVYERPSSKPANLTPSKASNLTETERKSADTRGAVVSSNQATVEVLQSSSYKMNDSPTQQMEKQAGKAEEAILRHVVSSPQATPARAAAIAAATAYTAKRSFLPRRMEPDLNARHNSYWDPDSEEDDDYGTNDSLGIPPARMSNRAPMNPKAYKASVSKETNKSAEDLGSEAGSVKTIPMIVRDTQAGSKSGSSGTTKEEVLNFRGQDRNTSPAAKDSKHFSENYTNGSKNTSVKSTNLTTPDRGNAKVPEEKVVSPESSRNYSRAENKYQSETIKTVVKPVLEEKHVLEQQVEGNTTISPVQPSKGSKNTNTDDKYRIPKSPRTSERKAGTEVKNKLSPGGRSTTAEGNPQKLEAEVEKLKSELRDVAALEAALYSTPAEHGGSSSKLHAPARRLARLYSHASKHWSKERRASCAWNTVSGLILTARACGNDVPRLTFWWSNATALREIISTNFNILPASPIKDMSNSKNSLERGRQSANSSKDIGNQQFAIEDWREPTTFIAALQRLEAWIYSKVVESIWWQVLTPHMQQPLEDPPSETDEEVFPKKKDVKNEKLFHTELEDSRQGSISVGIWKKAFLDAFEKLCPVRRIGVECGCLPMLNKMVLETCLSRLDVAMFNAILRDDDAPTDPISDPITDKRCLPISTSSLSFGLGAQLKNAVATLASWLTNLVNKDGDSTIDCDAEEDDRGVVMFPLLKAMGGFLMLPKDMLMDSTLRKEVCPTLNLISMARILSRFKPDEFSPEPVSPELLDTINEEIEAENNLDEDSDDFVSTLRIAFAPAVVYSPPQSSLVRQWIGATVSSNGRLRRSNSSILRKSYTSDDEIDELESPISWLLENTNNLGYDQSSNGKATKGTKDTAKNVRFKLLRDVWNS